MRRPPRLVVALLALAIPAFALSAHPRLVRSTPATGTRSAAPVTQVALSFNEAVDLALTRVTIVRANVPLRVDALQLAPTDDKTVVASFRTALAPGVYVVRWQVTGDDGHPVRGEVTFEVTASTTPSVRPAPRS